MSLSQGRGRPDEESLPVRAVRPNRNLGLGGRSHFASQVDNVAMIRSMYTIHPEHEPALLWSIRADHARPAGDRILGHLPLGTENQNLPAYVVLDDPLGCP